MTDIVAEMTNKLLVDAGIKKGMSVLDIGCGRGDLALLLAEIVGTEGSVLGLDFDESALAFARERFRENKLTNAAFIHADLNNLSLDHPQFDAIVGRRVLMYLPEPERVIADLGALLKVGGLMIFQEHDSTMSPGSIVPMPLHDQVNKWIWDTVEREGGNTHMGFGLWNLLAQKGLAVEKVRAEAVVQTPSAPFPLTPIVRAMLKRIIQTGAATEEEIDITTLEHRLDEEREKSKTTYIREMVFCAWARKFAL
ncbi:methyltransferase domain-containing protein [Desulfosporosinus sp. PR]|uniref:methyltransferase domain-containing protein n=1 Tax=Candidatus Desulfosporosinus nitrosoreducens TaxID=3401928 RepID=UPI0027FF8750|nr:methyltransferase domain-containing protein [Desulfosporosinus sp. PR]MDQ7092841.1 methyltransferase domain-containing protein [Desulfosporosinus sp. PR]